MRKTHLLPILALVPALRASADPGEVRAIWVTRWDYQTERDVRTIVGNCRSLGLSRIYFQVRGQADAFYRSEIEPWGEELGGRDPGFDPLEVAIAEARLKGLELHAWMNVLAGWKGKTPPTTAAHIVHRHPDWFLLDRYGERHLLENHYTIVNPCLPDVRRHITSVACDIVGRYPIDGLHMDYIRFIAREPKARQAVPYDNITLSRFRKLTGGFPVRYPERWNDFRRQAVDALVGEVSRAVRRRAPACTVSAAVLPDLERGREVYFQDAALWRARGWVDEIVPMNYRRDLEVFSRHARDSLRRAGRDQVVCGVGAYRFKEAGELSRQIRLGRSLGLKGYSLFAYASFFPSPSPAARVGSAFRALRLSLREELLRLNRRSPAPTTGQSAGLSPQRGMRTRRRS